MRSKKNKGIDRRDFLEITGKTAVGISLTSLPFMISSCSENKTTKTTYGACYHDCPDRCSWKVTTTNNKVVGFEASQNPYTAGKLCDKMDKFPSDVTYHPNRILTPLKRTGLKGKGEFKNISWEQAISEVASKLLSIIEEKGGESILPYSFGGNQGKVQSKAPNRFLHILELANWKEQFVAIQQ